MSRKVMDEIFSRLHLDEQFRKQLRANPEQALAGYDLTPEQRARWSKLKKRPAQKDVKKVDHNSANRNLTFSLN